MRTLLLFLSCFLLACFDPVIPSGLTCDSEQPTSCPSGQICDVAKRCCKPIGGFCGEQPDLLVSVDQTPFSGCAFGGGVQLGDNLWACKGIWELGKASSLCRNRLAKGSEVDRAAHDKCLTLQGFYLTTDSLWPIEPKSGTCQAPEGQSCTVQNPITFNYRLGCGGYKSFKKYRDCAVKCGLLYQAVICFGPESGYTCTVNTIDDKNTDPMMGVLCVT